ncbi:MAG: hypothetical protein GY757_02345 [bacterium]|nr:hypothetical protein [bacterium]
MNDIKFVYDNLGTDVVMAGACACAAKDNVSGKEDIGNTLVIVDLTSSGPGIPK